MEKVRLLMAGFCVALLTACGGGSGDPVGQQGSDGAAVTDPSPSGPTAENTVGPNASLTGDITPPTISTNAPAVADSAKIDFDITCADDEMLFKCGVDRNLVPANVAETSIKYSTLFPSVILPLGQVFKGRFFAQDTSGNTAITDVEIKTPKTGIPIGSYEIQGPIVTPAGFDCQAAALGWPSMIDGAQLTTIDYRSYTPFNVPPDTWLWDSKTGYVASAQVSAASGTGLAGFGLRTTDLTFNGGGMVGGPDNALRKIPLDAKNFEVGKSPAGYYNGPSLGGIYYTIQTFYEGNLSYNSENEELTLEVNMGCLIENPPGSTVQERTGTPMTLTAKIKV